MVKEAQIVCGRDDGWGGGQSWIRTGKLYIRTGDFLSFSGRGRGVEGSPEGLAMGPEGAEKSGLKGVGEEFGTRE